MTDLEIRERYKLGLGEGYGAWVRRCEMGSIAVYAAAMFWLALRLAPRTLANPWLALSAFMLGFVAADCVSGCVHWAADTWGTPEWPIIGKALIRPFREHHVDQKEITRHDFIETNGNNCFISIGPTVAAALLPHKDAAWFFVAAMVFALCLSVFGTNQFHKWAHMDDPLPAVRVRPRADLILLAERIGTTERAAQRSVMELNQAGYLVRAREGRRNRYATREGRPRHQLDAGLPLRELLGLGDNTPRVGATRHAGGAAANHSFID